MVAGPSVHQLPGLRMALSPPSTVQYTESMYVQRAHQSLYRCACMCQQAELVPAPAGAVQAP